MGAMDLSSLGFDSVCKYREIWQGEEWMKVNYDSGAATTAFPVELAGNLPMEKVGHFIVASGADIPNYGRVRVRCSDEMRRGRKLETHFGFSHSGAQAVGFSR